MTDLSLTDFFLTGMITYGPAALALALLLGALGLPLPGTLFVVAAGAFIRQGVLEWATTTPLAFLGVILGDSCSYAIGRFARAWVQRRFGASPTWQKAQATFDRRGGTAIYLTRFLLTPLAIPTNLIAGSSAFPFHRFLFYVAVGEATWILLYGGLGYTFGSQWELISQFLTDFSGLLVGLLILGVGIYLLIRRWKR